MFACGVEQLDGPQQRSGVHVVAAGVHHAGLGGGVGHVVGFLDGQGVHVRPERDEACIWVLSLDRGDNPGVRDMRFVVHAPGRKLGGHKGHGFVLLKRQFRIGVEVATQGDPLVVMRGSEGLKLLREGSHGQRVGLS